MKLPTLKTAPLELKLRIIETIPTDKAAALLDDKSGSLDDLAAAIGMEQAIKLIVVFHNDFNGVCHPCIPKPSQDIRTRNKIECHIGQEAVEKLNEAYATEMYIYLPSAEDLLQTVASNEIECLLLKDWEEFTQTEEYKKESVDDGTWSAEKRPVIGWTYHKAQKYGLDRSDLISFICYTYGIS